MSIDLEKEKKKVEFQKRRLRLKEALLREKERQQKFKRISEIVELTFKANIDHLDDKILLGAFLEIADKMADHAVVDQWEKNASLFQQEERPNTLISISFKADPQKETKERLKSWKFRWNAFRKEYCGYGNKKEIESFLKNEDFIIEIIS